MTCAALDSVCNVTASFSGSSSRSSAARLVCIRFAIPVLAFARPFHDGSAALERAVLSSRYHLSMAVIHIPEAEAVVDFRAVLRQVDSGDRIIIDRPGSTLELHTATSRGKTVSEALSILKDRKNQVADPAFADDLRAAVDSIRSLPTRSSAWD